MLTGLEDLTADGRNSGMRTVDAYIKGTPLPNFFETQDGLDLKALKDAAVAASKLAAKTPLLNDVRMDANYKVALYRDALYARSGRRVLQGLGVHNIYRTLYEGGKLGIDSKGT